MIVPGQEAREATVQYHLDKALKDVYPAIKNYEEQRETNKNQRAYAATQLKQGIVLHVSHVILCLLP